MTAGKDDGKTAGDRPAAPSQDKPAAATGPTNGPSAKPQTPASDTASPSSGPAKTGSTGSSVVKPETPKESGTQTPKPSEPVKGPAAGGGNATTIPATPGTASSMGGPSKAASKPAQERPASTAQPAAGSATPVSSAEKPSSESASSGAPLKAAATGSSAVPPLPGSKPDERPSPAAPSKTGAPGSSAFGLGQNKEQEKPVGSGASSAGPKPGGGATGATRVGASDSLTDGPILDLKAKRVGDPPGAKGADAEPPRSGPTPKIEPQAASASPGSGPSLGTIAASGLIGGAVGAGLFFALAQSGAIGTDGARLDALDRKVADLAPRDAVAGLDRRVGVNEQALKSLPDAVKVATDRANEALQKAQGSPGATAAEPGPSAAAASPELLARIDALDQRVSALQEEPGKDQPADSKLSVAPEGDEAMRLARLDERLKALETKGGERPAGNPTAEFGQTLATLQGDVEARAKVNETADKALAKRIEDLQQTLDQRVKSATESIQSAADAGKKAAEATRVQADEAAKGFDRRFREQGDRIAALDKAVDGAARAATLQAALRVVAAERIVTALNTGAPYADALASLRYADAGNDASRLETLAPFADTGAPTVASLAAAFRPIADKLADAKRKAKAKEVAESGGVADRLQAMAASVVQVKRAGAPTPEAAPAANDDDPGTKVRDALDRGRIADAAQAFAALPEEAKAEAGNFGAKLKARAEADAAAQSLQSDAFKVLAAPAAGR